MIGHVEKGIWMFGRFSIGWNFHPDRNMNTVGLPLALTWVKDKDRAGPRIAITFGPITFLWLL